MSIHDIFVDVQVVLRSSVKRSIIKNVTLPRKIRCKKIENLEFLMVSANHAIFKMRIICKSSVYYASTLS